jgi:hypothetical protein
MTSPAGPIFIGRFEEHVVDDDFGEQYVILFLPMMLVRLMRWEAFCKVVSGKEGQV